MANTRTEGNHKVRRVEEAVSGGNLMSSMGR